MCHQTADAELARLPQAQHGTMLRIVTTELNAWLQAITAGARSRA
jgi:hypothetical protein